MKRFLIIALTLICSAGVAMAEGSFEVIASSWSTTVFDISADGTWAAGTLDGAAYRWSAGTGLELLTPEEWLWTHTAGISDDGTKMTSTFEYGDRIFGPGLWTEGSGWAALDTLYMDPPYQGGTDWSFGSGYDISGDGSKIIGLAWHPEYKASGFTWSLDDGIMELERPFDPDRSSRASAISGDGSTVVGFYEAEWGGRRPARWAYGNPAADLFLGEATWGEAMGCTTDGSVIVGDVGFDDDPGYGWSMGFVYTEGEGHQMIDILPWQDPFWDRTIAMCISDNGIVGGLAGSTGPWSTPYGFIWTEECGTQLANDFFADYGVVIPPDVDIINVGACSADGTTFGGQCIDWSTWSYGAYVITIVPRVEMPLDVKPGGCPNAFNPENNGVLPVALLGSADIDINMVDPFSITLSRGDCVGGLVTLIGSGMHGTDWHYDDVGTPFYGEGCECDATGPDGYTDIVMHFKSGDLKNVLFIDDLPHKAEIPLVLKGTLVDGTEFEATDCVRKIGQPKLNLNAGIGK